MRQALRDGLHLRGLLDGVGRGVRTEVLRNTLPDQQQCVNHASRHQHIEQRPRHVHPEVADGGGGGPLDPANQRDGDHDARGGGPEVMRRQPHHLGEIAHRGFAGIKLPVGVGGETGGGVESQIRAHCGQVLRVERQVLLQSLNGVCKHHRDCGKAQQRVCVLPPVHLLLGVDDAELVNEPLAGAEHGVKPGALALNNPGEIDSDRADQCEQNYAVDGELQPAIRGHF